MASNTCRYNSLHEQFILWGLSGGSSSGGEVCCGNRPCKGSPWFLTGHEFYGYSLEKLLRRPGDPFFYGQRTLISCQVAQLVPIRVEFVSTMKREEAKLRTSSLSCCWNQSVSGVTNTWIKSSDVCEVWALVVLYVKQSGRRQSVLTGGGGGWGSGGGCCWGTSGHFRCRRWGREWRLLVSTLHTLFNGPFLRQTNWT